jgi:hypothetical protein
MLFLLVYAFTALAFVSLLAMSLAAIGLRRARWFLLLAGPLATFAGWLVLHDMRVQRAEDSVGPADVPRLIRSLETDSGRRWEGSVTLLSYVGDDAVPALRSAFQHPNRKVRLGAAQALGRMGVRAHQAGPALPAIDHYSELSCRQARRARPGETKVPARQIR